MLSEASRLIIFRLKRFLVWALGSLLVGAVNSLGWIFTMPLRRRSRLVVVAGLVLVAVLLLIVPVGDRRTDSVVTEASIGYSYGLVGWEFENFFDKWGHRIWRFFPWTPTGDDDRRTLIARYVVLADELQLARLDFNHEISGRAPDPKEIAARQAKVNRLVVELDAIKDGVEEYLEQVIAGVVNSEEVGLTGVFVWPPVDFRLDNPPKLLVTSPRDEILRGEETLLAPDIPAQTVSSIEDRLKDDHDLSAIVVQTGGFSSFPSVVPATGLKQLLDVASHEWLHAYLSFRPLGWAYFGTSEMRTLNESLADLFGHEVGLRAYSKIMGEPFIEPARPDFWSTHRLKQRENLGTEAFNFNEFMFETRQRTDALLGDGMIDEAEAYMEVRRLELVSNGYGIRKINQAYFAFTGTYAENPSSTSPISRYLWDLRDQVDTVGELVKLLQYVNTNEEFEQLLVRREVVLLHSE
jgi:hypothetical protein